MTCPPPVEPAGPVREGGWASRRFGQLTRYLHRHDLDWHTVLVGAGILLVVLMTFVIGDDGSGIGCAVSIDSRPSGQTTTVPAGGG